MKERPGSLGMPGGILWLVKWLVLLVLVILVLLAVFSPETAFAHPVGSDTDAPLETPDRFIPTFPHKLMDGAILALNGAKPPGRLRSLDVLN